MADLKGLVCYLSAIHRPDQVSATTQPICFITVTFSHFPDNVLHPLNPSCFAFSLRLLAFPVSAQPPPLFLSSILSLSFILLFTLLYLYLPSPIHHFALSKKTVLPFSSFFIASLFLITFPFS